MILVEIPRSKCPRLLCSNPKLDELRPSNTENGEEHVVAMVSYTTSNKHGRDDCDYRPVYGLTTKGNNVLLGSASGLEQQLVHLKVILEEKYNCQLRLSLESLNQER